MPSDNSSAPHSVTDPVAVTTASAGSLTRDMACARRASGPAAARRPSSAPPRSGSSFPANMLPARNNGMM